MSRIMRRAVLEGALHHDQPGHLQHRIDVGFLEETLRHADVEAVDDGLRLAGGHDAGIAEADEVRAGIEIEQAERADEIVALAQRAVGAGARRAVARIELDRRAAGVENRIALDRHQLAVLGHA